MHAADYHEIYRQRYETYRHLDRLRWQMLQIAIAVGALVVTFGDRGSEAPEWWVLVGSGWLIATLGVVMLRLNGGIKKNGTVLSSAAAAIGDDSIPAAGPWWKSSAAWAALLVFVFGLSCFSAGVWLAQYEEPLCTESSSATTTAVTNTTKTN